MRGGLGILKYALVEAPSYPDLLESVRNLSRRDLKLKSPLAGYMVETHNLTREALERLLREADPELWETVMPTAAEEWRQEGRAEGLAEGLMRGKAEGRAEGKAEGKAETLLRQLERRFGAVPEDARARVLSAPIEDLDAWLDAIVSASSLDEVFRNGAIH